ncbi:MAG TPA: sugar phosphate isomerase/epimerase [Eudoraea sp.]|nr:sugar phosphate isomerase/epimerase [Eudoraea sp.]
MERIDFIRNLAFFTAGGTLLPDYLLAGASPEQHPSTLKNIGVQLFSLPSSLENDFKGTISLLANMGFREIELFGPYPYSAKSAKQRWKTLMPKLGFSGSGYFGHTEEDIKNICKESGLTIPSIHTDLDTLQHKMKDLGRAGEHLGFHYVVLPAIPGEYRKTLEDYRKMADTFNSIGRQAKEVGLKFAYHNHGYGLHEVNGEIPLQLMLDNTDPDLVFLEIDLFWTIAGGADPVMYLEKYHNRYHLMHVKDMKKIQTFSGDGGDDSQWIPLFPNMTSAGSGVIDLETIIPTAQQHGVRHFFVEQDLVKDPDVALKKSFDYLSSL